MDLEKLSSELKEGKTVEEIVKTIKEAGRELTEDQLKGIAGGHMWDDQVCPKCGSKNTEGDTDILPRGNMVTFKCNDCGHRFEIDGLEVKKN